MKLLKLLAVPAVVVFSVVTAVSAFATGITKADFDVQCGPAANASRFTFRLTGDVEVHQDQDNDAKRVVVFALFAASDKNLTTPLGQASPVTVMAGDDTPFDSGVLAFPATTNPGPFVIAVISVTDEDGNASDFELRDANNKLFLDVDPHGNPPKNTPTVVTSDNDQNANDEVGEPPFAACPAPPTTPATTPPTSITPASTGGFDLRFPLIGLTAMVAGIALLLISASRGRSTTR